jgi:hypothetical protein
MVRLSTSKTLADEIIERVGFTESLRVARFIAFWGLYHETHGIEPASIDDLAAFLGKSKSWMFKLQSSFREAFPEYKSPAILWDRARDQVEGTDPDVLVMKLGAVELP